MQEHKCFFPTLLALVHLLHLGVTTSLKQTVTGNIHLVFIITGLAQVGSGHLMEELKIR